MADSNLVAMNSLYGISDVVYSAKDDTKNTEVIKLQSSKLQFVQQHDVTKENVALNDDVEPEDPIPSNVNNETRFAGYIDQDYDENQLQKRIGNYWITNISKNIVMYTGYEFVLYDSGRGAGQADVTKLLFTNGGTATNIIPVYPQGVTYQSILALWSQKTIVYIEFLGDIYRVGNKKTHSLQYSFSDEDNYKQLRLFDSTQEYRTEYFVQSKSNYEQINEA